MTTQFLPPALWGLPGPRTDFSGHGAPAIKFLPPALSLGAYTAPHGLCHGAP